MNGKKGKIEYPIYQRNFFTCTDFESSQSTRRKVPIS